MSFKVVILGSGIIAPGLAEEILGQIGVAPQRVDPQTEAEVLAAAADADAIMRAGGVPFTRSLIEGLQNCKIISCFGVATYDVDLPTATEKGICVSHMPDLTTEEVTDHIMALILACARRVVRGHQIVKAGGWRYDNEEPRQIGLSLRRLQGQTLGMVGFGRAGSALARKAAGFGLRLLAYDPYISQETAASLGVTLTDYETILKEADFAAILAPLTRETYQMFNREAFAKMKPTAYLFNATGSGALIDEDALYEALRDGVIAGAGLDTTEPMPVPPSNPLLTLDNITWTPHIGFQSQDSLSAIQSRMCQNVITRLSGQWPALLANPQVTQRVQL